MSLASFLRRLGLLATITVLLALPASASALQFHVVNESGRPESEVFVDIAGAKETQKEEEEKEEHGLPKTFEVPGFSNDEAKALSEIPGQEVTVDRLISGRVYVSYGAPVHEGVTVQSPTRFDWADLTAVNQVGIGMRLTTLGENGDAIQSVSSTYSDTLFDALQQIPGGPQSTVRAPDGEILRVLSPDNVNSAYPPLIEYVQSMAGKTITLHTAFFGAPFTTSEYTGTFQSDGSIDLTGEKNEYNGKGNVAAPEIKVTGPELLEDIYTGGTGENDLEFAVRRDLYSAFSNGLWGGKYGNDASAFCTNYDTTAKAQGYCPERFNVPAFAEARTVAAPFQVYEEYASVINELTDVYGNPFSDASKNVQVVLDQPHVKTLQLTILPDSPPASGSDSSPGSGNAPAGGSAAKAPTPAILPSSQVTFKLAKTAKLKHGKLAVGSLTCKGACGKVVALLRPKRGKAVIAREAVTIRKAADALILKPTKAGKPLLKGKGPLATKLTVIVTQPGQRPAQKQVPLKLLR
jgi:hypothetical protein